MERYYSANEYYKKRFGRKMFRLAVDCGFTCPNRDGTKGIGGCSFCSGEGSGDFAARGADVAAALQCARERISEKTAIYATFRHLRTHMLRSPACGSCLPQQWRWILFRH